MQTHQKARIFGVIALAVAFLSFLYYAHSRTIVSAPANDIQYVATDEGVDWAWDELSAQVPPSRCLSCADDACEQIDIGFNFQFFGRSRTEVNISTNGFLTFGSCCDCRILRSRQPVPKPGPCSNPTCDFVNTCIPDQSCPNDLIAPFWDDLFPGAACDSIICNGNGNPQPGMGKPVKGEEKVRNGAQPGIYYQTLGSAPNRRLVVEWYKIPHYFDPCAQLTFQATLFEGTNCIKFQYKDMVNGEGVIVPTSLLDGSRKGKKASQSLAARINGVGGGDFADGRCATIGLENVIGTVGLEWFCGNCEEEQPADSLIGTRSNGAGPIPTGEGVNYAIQFCPQPVPVGQGADGDGDGVISRDEKGWDCIIEGEPCEDYDGNQNGIPDHLESGVTSMPTYGGDRIHYITMELPPGTGQFFRHVESPKALPEPPPPGVTLPFGLVKFTVECPGPSPQSCGCTTVRIHPDAEPPQTYWKYGYASEAAMNNDVKTYYELPAWNGDPNTPGVEIIDDPNYEYKTIVLHLCDGKLGDNDWTDNGFIEDPGGPGAVESADVLYFPYLSNTGGEETALGLINKEFRNITGTISYYGGNGTPLLPVRALTMPGSGKVTIPSTGVPTDAVSAIIAADGEVVGYARYTGAGGQQYAVPGATHLSNAISIPHVITIPAVASTKIGLFNPTEGNVTVTILDSAGSSSVVTLGAKVQSFFPVTGSPYQINVSGGSIAAMEVFEILSPGGDRAAVLLGNLNQAELFVPSISSGTGDATGLTLGNPSSSEGTVTGFGYDASLAEEELSLGALPARSATSGWTLSTTFGADTLWAKVKAERENPTSIGAAMMPLPVQGLTTYGEAGLAKVGAVSLNDLAFKDGCLGVVTGDVSPTFALVNPGTVDAIMTATAYDSGGTVIATSGSTTIAAGTNLTGTLESLVGGAALDSGDYVRIISNVDLYGLETVADGGRIEMLPVLQ